MARRSRWRSCAALLLWVAATAAGCKASLSPNLVNAGFDAPADAEGMPPGWFIEADARRKGAVAVVEGFAGATGRVLQLKPNDANSGDKLLGFGQLIDARPWRGRALRVTARAAAADGAVAIFGVHVLGVGGDLGSVQLRQSPEGRVLRQQQQTLSVPESADSIVVYVTTTGLSGTVWFDAVSLGDATASSDAAPPRAAVTGVDRPSNDESTFTVSVDPARVLRRIPPTLYGTNAEWIFEGQGLWSPKAGQLDAAAMRRVRELGPTLIRFPGGVFSDFYHWKDGVGPQADRPTTPNLPNGDKSRHSLGSQEIAEVARDAGAALMFTANAGTGTAEEAAAWVSYAKQNVTPHVGLWEVGNELYMKSDLSGGSMSAKDYARRYLAFAAAMRAVDPDIKVGAIGGLNYGPYRFIADDRWSETLLKAAAPQIDFISVHNAYAPLVIGVTPRTDPRRVYRAMLAAPRLIENNLRTLSALLDRTESPSHRIAVAITEWGPSFHFLPDNPWVDHVKTMGSALYVASTLNVFLRAPRVEIANFFKLTDYGFMGWIRQRGDDWAMTAPALAFSLYRHRLGNTLVQADVSSPGFDSPALGAVDAVTDAPWVDAVATHDGDEVVVMLVNRNETRAFDGRIVLKGVKTFENVTADSIAADSLDANTGTELPRIPGLTWAPQVDLGRMKRGGDAEIRRARVSLASSGADAGTRGDATLAYRIEPLSIVAIRFGRVEIR